MVPDILKNGLRAHTYTLGAQVLKKIFPIERSKFGNIYTIDSFREGYIRLTLLGLDFKTIFQLLGKYRNNSML